MKTIPLTKGMVALVDDEDFDFLNQWKWTSWVGKKTVYAHRKQNGTNRNVYMHRVITKAKNKQFVDHKDHNGLNNQKSNLRLCTKNQNNGNSRLSKTNRSGFKGVRWHLGRWQAEISEGNKNIYLGRFVDYKDAVAVYDNAAVNIFGDFALTNQMMGTV